jgi:hypothetical protein
MIALTVNLEHQHEPQIDENNEPATEEIEAVTFSEVNIVMMEEEEKKINTVVNEEDSSSKQSGTGKEIKVSVDTFKMIQAVKQGTQINAAEKKKKKKAKQKAAASNATG